MVFDVFGLLSQIYVGFCVVRWLEKTIRIVFSNKEKRKRIMNVKRIKDFACSREDLEWNRDWEFQLRRVTIGWFLLAACY